MFSDLRAQMKADIYIFINDISSQCVCGWCLKSNNEEWTGNNTWRQDKWHAIASMEDYLFRSISLRLRNGEIEIIVGWFGFLCVNVNTFPVGLSTSVYNWKRTEKSWKAQKGKMGTIFFFIVIHHAEKKNTSECSWHSSYLPWFQRQPRTLHYFMLFLIKRLILHMSN